MASNRRRPAVAGLETPPLLLLLLLLATATRVALCARTADRVFSLPGLQASLPSALYSGFLTTAEDSVHYMLVESESNPAKDPLVLWLNGGPGSSALIGFFQELGPTILTTNTTLVRNPYSWSKAANLLFLESPTGVGYSYCAAMMEMGGKCKHSDTSTAALNAATLHRFLEAFPEYRGREFMIWGESYAGVYIPTLAEQVLATALDVNFLGFAAGDPCTSEKYQHLDGQLHFNLQFALQRGFISARLHTFITSACVRRIDGTGRIIPDYTHPDCKRAWRTYFISSSDVAGYGAHASLQAAAFVNPFDAYAPSNYLYNRMLREYLSAPAVRAALHVNAAPAGQPNMTQWAHHLTYTKEYMACFHEEDTPSVLPRFNSSMIQVYQRLAGVLPRILVFNGDTDPCMQFQGTEDTVAAFGLRTTQGGDWRPWFFKPSAAPAGLILNKSPYWGRPLSHRPGPVQLAGYVTNYDLNVSFVTVHDAGHMVPMYQPEVTLHMFQRVLAGAPLSPPLDEDGLEGSTDEEFFGGSGSEGAMLRWIKRAQSDEFVDPPPPRHDPLLTSQLSVAKLSRKQNIDAL